MSASRCIGSSATNGVATVSVCDLTDSGNPYLSIDCGHTPMQHVCPSTSVYHAHVLIVYQTCFWNNEILTPIQKNGMIGPGKTAFKKLKILLDRMMLRRTKVCFSFRSDH